MSHCHAIGINNAIEVTIQCASTSLRSKHFCGFSEQRKTEERDFDNFAAQEMGTSEKMERGGRGKESWNKKWRFFRSHFSCGKIIKISFFGLSLL